MKPEAPVRVEVLAGDGQLPSDLQHDHGDAVLLVALGGGVGIGAEGVLGQPGLDGVVEVEGELEGPPVLGGAGVLREPVDDEAVGEGAGIVGLARPGLSGVALGTKDGFAFPA